MEDITIIGSSDEDGSDIEMMEAPKSSPPQPPRPGSGHIMMQ